MEKAEIVIYKQDDVSDFQIEVRIENETVWLNRQQLALLFDRDVKTIGKHVANAIKEELRSFPVIAKFATTATDGKVYQVEYYNLDIKKHNIQYPSIEVETFTRSHDRFLIVDEKTIYHIGASLKDLGKKWFAFSKMNLDIKDLLSKMMD
ncbi:MAG: hypothetical protein EOM90_12105 [Alphaproteobacteria bacterium]|nr:hypothetical protein [Alphaproteobacteria bacterium]